MTSELDRPAGSARAPGRRRGGAAALAALLMAACVPAGPAPADCPGCVPPGSEAGVRFRFDPWTEGDTTSVLTVTFDDGRRVRTTRSTAWSAETRQRFSPYFETAASDSLRVSTVLHSAAGDTLAVGGLVLPLHPDRHWGVDAALARRSTILSLPGIDPQRFRHHWRLRGQEGAADPVSLYLVYGGGSISRPTPR
jgi:hypothetical protein